MSHDSHEYCTLKRKMGIPDKRPLVNFLPTISIKAKDFAAEMTSVNVQAKGLHGAVSHRSMSTIMLPSGRCWWNVA